MADNAFAATASAFDAFSAAIARRSRDGSEPRGAVFSQLAYGSAERLLGVARIHRLAAAVALVRRRGSPLTANAASIAARRLRGSTRVAFGRDAEPRAVFVRLGDGAAASETLSRAAAARLRRRRRGGATRPFEPPRGDFWLAVAGNAFLRVVMKTGELMAAVYLESHSAAGTVDAGLAAVLASCFTGGPWSGGARGGGAVHRRERRPQRHLTRRVNALSLAALSLLAADAPPSPRRSRTRRCALPLVLRHVARSRPLALTDVDVAIRFARKARRRHLRRRRRTRRLRRPPEATLLFEAGALTIPLPRARDVVH